MPAWRKRHFFGMLRNAQSATEFFRIPSNLVVELATPPWNYDGNGRDRGRD
jgi:KUP system potassium uptake protein